MTTETVIVYRNRAEHDFYESGMMVPLMGALLVGFVVFVSLMRLAQGLLNNMRGAKFDTMMVIVSLVSLVAGGFTFNWLMI